MNDKNLNPFLKTLKPQWRSLLQKSAAKLKSAKFIERIAVKDPTLWKEEANHKTLIQNSLGWLQVPEWMEAREQELLDFAEEVRKTGFKDVALLGMGGSSLSGEVMRQVLFRKPKKGYPKLSMLDSTDPEWIRAFERKLDLKKTLFIVASKSGTTIEPLTFFHYFFARAQKQGAQFVAITDPGSYLEKQARGLGFRKVFLNPPDIGGRFSALSYFGLLPATLAGLDPRAFLNGARNMMRDCLNPANSESNPGLLLGTALGEFARMGRNKVTLILPKELASLSLWIEQLLAESSGKENKGLVPIAFEQGVKPAQFDSDRIFVYTYFSGKQDPKLEKIASTLEKSAPVLRIPVNSPMQLGAEFFRWEFATAVACSILGVNAFDQPGVQSAKDQTKALLQSLKSEGKLPLPPTHWEHIGATGTFSQSALRQNKKTVPAKAIKIFCRQAKTNEYIGLLAYLPNLPWIDKELSAMKQRIFKQCGKPVLFGYGPRYLHSTGQLQKDGPNSGLFIILTADHTTNLPIPDQTFSFNDLELAQAVGDFQALDAQGRRTLFIRLQKPLKKSLPSLNKQLS